VGQETTEEQWRAILTGEHRPMLALRRSFGRLPSPPRCKLCYAPFHGIPGALLKPWFGPWERNPQLCKNCMKALTKQGVGGAEVEISLLFVDIRGSTGIGERLGPAAFAALLTAFYRLAADAIVETDGVVDKFVGDGAMRFFIEDVVIHPERQGQGLGRRIMDALMTWLEHSAPSSGKVYLMAAEGSVAFYEHYGFERRAETEPGMWRRATTERGVLKCSLSK
jgi:adenylate cyclase